jgi:hypothetical protein
MSLRVVCVSQASARPGLCPSASFLDSPVEDRAQTGPFGAPGVPRGRHLVPASLRDILRSRGLLPNCYHAGPSVPAHPCARAKSGDGRNLSARKPRGDGGARRSGRVMRRYYVGCERSWSGGSPAGASGGTDPGASRSSLSMSRTGSFCPAASRANGPSSVHNSASRARASATYEASNALRRPSVAPRRSLPGRR